MKSLVPVLVIAALLAGCGGAGGPRRLQISRTDDAGSDVVVMPPFMCSSAVAPLNCAAPFMLPADGHVTDFSRRE